VRFATALAAGLLFGLGLAVSGMIDPANVLGFLDVGGVWRPALAFTMAGAILAAAPAYWYVRRNGRTPLGERAELPERRRTDGNLVAGSAIFGVGWGLSGLCPGPALMLLAGHSWQAFAFVASLVLGMALARRSEAPACGSLAAGSPTLRRAPEIR
jgi:uncharacterized membrane protein YedE/YeeE